MDTHFGRPKAILIAVVCKIPSFVRRVLVAYGRMAAPYSIIFWMEELTRIRRWLRNEYEIGPIG